MALFGRTTLGIAWSSRSLHVTEVSEGGQRSAEFQFADGQSLQEPVALGKSFAEFLKLNRFSARQAFAGVPAQWLMLREKLLPAASADALARMLNLQAEQDFSMEPASLVLDYIGAAETAAGKPVVLIAVLRERVEQLRQFALAAGVKLLGVTGTALALANALGYPRILYFGANGVELATQNNDVPVLRYICPASAVVNRSAQQAAQTMSGELRRALALTGTDGNAGELAIVDDLGAEPAIIKELSALLKTPVRVAASSAEFKIRDSAAGSTAVALCALRPGLAPIDFLRSRLALKPASRFGSMTIWGAVAGIAFLSAGAWIFSDLRQSESEIADFQQKRDDMKENIDKAKSFISRVGATRTWYDMRPNYLECMRVLTLCFPAEGRVWTSNLSLKEDMHGLLTGRASDEKSVLEVLDKLKSNGAFSEVKMLHMRGSGAKNSEITFAVSFVWGGNERLETGKGADLRRVGNHLSLGD